MWGGTDTAWDWSREYHSPEGNEQTWAEAGTGGGGYDGAGWGQQGFAGGFHAQGYGAGAAPKAATWAPRVDTVADPLRPATDPPPVRTAPRPGFWEQAQSQAVGWGADYWQAVVRTTDEYETMGLPRPAAAALSVLWVNTPNGLVARAAVQYVRDEARGAAGSMAEFRRMGFSDTDATVFAAVKHSPLGMVARSRISQFETTRADFGGYRSKGASPVKAAFLAAANNIPVVSAPNRIFEAVHGVSFNGRDLGRPLDPGERALAFGMAVLDIVTAGAGTAAKPAGLAGRGASRVDNVMAQTRRQLDAADAAKASVLGGRVPGMATPGIPNSKVLDFVKRNTAAIDRGVAHHMKKIGVPDDKIGIKGWPGVDEGGFVRYSRPQGGGNLRPDHPNVLSGRWQAGINVDEAIFDPTFDALAGAGTRITNPQARAAYNNLWGKASARSRLEAVTAHEYTELNALRPANWSDALHGPWNPHNHAIRFAPEQSGLTLSKQAQDLLRLQRQALGLE